MLLEIALQVAAEYGMEAVVSLNSLKIQEGIAFLLIVETYGGVFLRPDGFCLLGREMGKQAQGREQFLGFRCAGLPDTFFQERKEGSVILIAKLFCGVLFQQLIVPGTFSYGKKLLWLQQFLGNGIIQVNDFPARVVGGISAIDKAAALALVQETSLARLGFYICDGLAEPVVRS